MPDDANTLTPESGTPTTHAAGEPAFLTRARRILSGNIRPDDYLPVTPEVRQRVDLFMDWARARANGQPPPLPEVEVRQLRTELLSFHHGGVNIAYIEDEKGIVVLGVDLEQSGAVLRAFPNEIDHPIWFGFGDHWFG